ncbi:MAG: hypothetical protein ACOX2B_10450 [Syntrophothermaceae bacterium]
MITTMGIFRFDEESGEMYWTNVILVLLQKSEGECGLGFKDGSFDRYYGTPHSGAG